MVFYCDYLGTVERSITLNFSRGASQIVGQYYQLLRLGKDGYTKIMSNLAQIASRLRKYIEESDHFDLVSQEVGVPLVAFKLKPVKHADGSLHKRLYDEFQVAERVRIAGWVIPAYTMPKGAEHIKLMRITIREDFSMSMADEIVDELNKAVLWLDNHFTISADKMTELANHMLGRRISKFDSKIMRDLTGVFSPESAIKPC